MKNNVKKIKKAPKDKITTVRLNAEQRKFVEMSCKVNEVKQSKVISEAVNAYFNLKDNV